LEFGKVLCGSGTAKCAVRAMVVVEVLEAVEDWVDLVDAAGQLVDGIELVAPGAVAALDSSIHLRRLWRQDEEANVVVVAGLLDYHSARRVFLVTARRLACQPGPSPRVNQLKPAPGMR
jgi:hypothetical protein